MRTPTHAIRMLLLAVALVTPTAAHAKSARNSRKPDVFASLKAGQWIRIEGVLLKDRRVQCTELKVLTGDFLDDDWTLTGQIDEVDARTRSLSIGPISIKVAEDAAIEGLNGRTQSFAAIRRGMIVEVDGTYLKDRTFLAMDVDDESDEITHPRGEQHLRVVGKVEAADPGRRRIQAMGLTFILTDDTQMKSVIR